MYYWKAKCIDGTYEDESIEKFETKKEAYDDMREAALEKMKWNTEYDEDYADGTEHITYDVEFRPNSITHTSYSGKYVYEIVEVPEIEEGLVEDPESGAYEYVSSKGIYYSLYEGISLGGKRTSDICFIMLDGYDSVDNMVDESKKAYPFSYMMVGWTYGADRLEGCYLKELNREIKDIVDHYEENNPEIVKWVLEAIEKGNYR